MKNKFFFTGDHFGAEADSSGVETVINNLGDSEVEYGHGKDLFNDDYADNADYEYQQAREEKYNKIIALL